MVMVVRLRYVFVVIALLCAFDGAAASPCGKSIEQRLREAVTIEGISRVTHLSTSGMNLWVDIRNDSSSRLVVKRAEIDILVGGGLRATISLRDRVVVERRSSGEVLIPLRFRSKSSFAFGALLRAIVEDRTEDITIAYRLRGGTMLFRRTIERGEVSIRELIDEMGLARDILSELARHVN